MTETISNLTNPGQTPVAGDIIERVGDNYSIREEFYVPEEPTDLEIARAAREWRDHELTTTDYIVPLSDHPSRTATMAYRVALRDWPSTSDFPDTKPTLGS